VQNSENSQFPNASKCFHTAKTVSWSPALCHMTKMIGAHGTVFTIFTVLEESGSSMLSLFSNWLLYKTVRK